MPSQFGQTRSPYFLCTPAFWKAQAGDATSIAAQVRRRGGILGLYRGIVPGSLSVFLRNGAAMIVMQRANRLITDLGLRE